MGGLGYSDISKEPTLWGEVHLQWSNNDEKVVGISDCDWVID